MSIVPPRPSKTLRASMGCSVRFTNPGCTEERRIETLSGQRAPHSAKTKEKPAGVNRRALIAPRPDAPTCKA